MLAICVIPGLHLVLNYANNCFKLLSEWPLVVKERKRLVTSDCNPTPPEEALLTKSVLCTGGSGRGDSNHDAEPI